MPELIKIFFGICISAMFLAVAFALGVVCGRGTQNRINTRGYRLDLKELEAMRKNETD